MMLKPIVAGNSEMLAVHALPLGLGHPTPEAELRIPLHSPAEVNLRRLRYFIDLFETGFRHALRPDPQAGSLRAERIALGIDVPELDAVPLWSACHGDGTVSIPFIEFIANEIDRSIEAFALEMKGGDPGGAGGLRARGRALRLLLESAGLRAKEAPVLPRLGDVFLSQDALDEVCGPRGMLRLIVRQCEETLLTEVAGQETRRTS
jgi:hypothetical protein